MRQRDIDKRNRQFARLYPRYERSIAGIARKLALRDEELFEDLTQVGAEALLLLDVDRATSNVDAWIRTAVRNRMVDFLRKYNPAIYESLDARLEAGDQVEALPNGELTLLTTRPAAPRLHHAEDDFAESDE